MNDTPTLPLTVYNYGEGNDLFRLYVMFQPPGADSRWVAARTLIWNWFAQADKNTPGFLVPGSNGPSPTAPTRASAPPVWSDVVQNGTWI